MRPSVAATAGHPAAKTVGGMLRRYPERVSYDAPVDAAREDREPPARGKYWWVRWAVIALAVIVLAVEASLVWDQLAKAWMSLLSANWWWVLAAVAAAMLSMHSFAQIQRTLLRSAGVVVHQWRSEAAFYAGNALSTTMPGGPVLSATFVYRQQRIWGASPVVASWQLVMSGALQVVGLALLGLGRRIPVGRQEQSVLAAVHARRLRRPAAARAGGGDPSRADRRHRGQGAGLGQFGARQARRHRRCRSGGKPSTNSSR